MRPRRSWAAKASGTCRDRLILVEERDFSPVHIIVSDDRESLRQVIGDSQAVRFGTAEMTSRRRGGLEDRCDRFQEVCTPLEAQGAQLLENRSR